MVDLRRVVNDITDLPTLPDVVARLNQAITSPDTSASDINDIISQDVSLSAKVLKLVNSPYYGFPRRITSITYAVVILGFKSIRNLALSAFVFDSFKRGIKAFDLKGFWRHCIGTAIAAQAVAAKSRAWQEEEAFMAGLLCGIGKVVMNQHLPADLEKVMQKVKSEDCLFREAEHALLEYDHNRLGSLLLDKWNLPSPLVEAALLYHEPEAAQTAGGLCWCVHLAHVLSRAMCMGFPGDAKIPRLRDNSLRELGLSWQDVAAIMERAGAEYERAGAFFELT